jgi:glycine/D-amino acid oxidase-like deaminating enzyme
MRSIDVAIVGGGTVGLSVATKLIESIEPLDVNVTITIIAEHFYEDTTSFGSGGLWEPYQIAGTPDEKINYWGKESFEHFRDIFYSDDAGIAGVQLITTYNLLKPGQRLEIPSWKDIVPNFQVLEEADLAKLGLSAKFTSGSQNS